MTPERRKYIASISKEEDFIREEIKGCKHLVRVLKDCIGIASCESVANLHKRDILRYKNVIKALKKQLPAPRKEYQNEYLDYYLCPICRWYAYRRTNYCSNCGKKLR